MTKGWLFDNHTLHVLEHLAHIHLFCQGMSPQGLVDWSSLSKYLYSGTLPVHP
jgi:hypothetical protein